MRRWNAGLWYLSKGSSNRSEGTVIGSGGAKASGKVDVDDGRRIRDER